MKPSDLHILIMTYLGAAHLSSPVSPDDDIRIVRVNDDGTRDEIGSVIVTDEQNEPREPWRGDA